MEDQKRRGRWWRFLYALIHAFVARRFRLASEPCAVEGPCLIVSNHVTTWDPLLLALSFPKTPIRFVASEHIFRHGWVSRLLERLVAPIARRKGSTGMDTVRACLRALKEGETVCIFAEGDASWDGLTHPIFPATGKLARSSGATLVTYRLEGGYLSLPRWSKKLRKGKMRGAAVGVYPAETLRKMKGEEITALINRDIFEDAWKRQRAEHVAFRAKNRAEGIEQGYFLCPGCGRVGTVRGVGDRIVCSCGFETFYTEEGFLDPPEPFGTLADWDAWQLERLKSLPVPEDGVLFSDDGMRLREIGSAHGEKLLTGGRLSQTADALICGETRFALSEISSMAIVKANLLLLTAGERYYEIRAESPCCLRKYLAVWQNNK